ncbi:52 kDa repressor of the inhibitor of the protein kinase-like [Mya arenaria]|uniref:52 kDa repressor of the inhibitor of the protein kinase-like n=1 Tax=Mya arenaria TaxID=6604 RepID=UPI0022E5300B|nr:52 kDa repressor of the inhibitor of the protein kinase-like [Mya arenaria]
MEQMAMCLRYFNGTGLREEFLGFAECESTTGESLANAFLANLERAGVHINHIRGQGYDGAANMSGIHRGVQARIRQRIPGAVYTHCKAHSLNLSIIHASKEMYARNMMGTVQQIAFAFNYSAKRVLRFQENLENDAAAREEMDRGTKLQSLCETRWAARAEALYTFLCSYRVVVGSLHELASDYGDTKAAGYSRSIQNFEFVITLVAVEHALSGFVNISKILQKKDCDLLEAAEEARVVITMMENERNDDMLWDHLYDKAVSLADDIGVEATVPRCHGRQANRPNAPAQTPSQFWRVNMYLPFVDHLIVELTNRLLNPHGRFTAQYLLPTKAAGLTPARTAEIYAVYQPDLPGCDQETFVRECNRWTAKWTTTSLAPYLCLESSLGVATEASYPNIRICMMILLCMPVSTATAERSFSTMKRVKTYLRNTMTTERLSGLGLLNIYQERNINVEQVVDAFARQEDRRLALIFKV